MKNKIYLLSASLMVATFSFFSCVSSGEKETGKDEIEKKVESLLGKMTLQEKIGQMNQLSPYGSEEEMYALVKEGKVGSFLNIVDAEVANKIQKTAVEQSRLGIPVLMARDVIHGYKTIFPICLGQAASFNPDLVRESARVAAIEASADGI